MSKLLERVASNPLKVHLAENNLRCPLQSAYKTYHSAESAIVKVHNDIAENLDCGKNVVVVQLD